MKQIIEVMVDTETTDVKYTAGVWQIGAVRTVLPEEIPDDIPLSFIRTLNPKGMMLRNPTLTSDKETINWQEQANSNNWAAALELTGDHLGRALCEFTDWLYAIKELAQFYNAEVRFWCKGTNFDFPILENAYKSFKLPAPWHYWQLNDLRTLCNVLQSPVPSFVGAHDALEDADHQLLHLNNLLSRLENL